VALVTWVTSTASHRCNLRALAEHGRQVGSLVGVDITQGVGIVPFDLAAMDVDFVVGSTLKWLCGVAGAGVLQVRASLIAECQPELRGWFSQDNPFAWGLDSFAYAGDARRFDSGTPSVLAAAACLPALDWHASKELNLLAFHSRQLCERLITGCTELGFTLVSPASADDRGGSVMFRMPANRNSAAVVGRLREQNLFTDCRGNILRISPGNMTTLSGVERLLGALRALL
jgi:kynureninase